MKNKIYIKKIIINPTNKTAGFTGYQVAKKLFEIKVACPHLFPHLSNYLTLFNINIIDLIKSSSFIEYNSPNNAHHSTCRVDGLFYWDNIK